MRLTFKDKNGREVTQLTKTDIDGRLPKPWVFFRLLNHTNDRPISFEELYYMCKWIGECEDEKYSEYYHKGRKMVIEFLTEAINGTKTYDELAEIYKLKPGTAVDKRQSRF